MNITVPCVHVTIALVCANNPVDTSASVLRPLPFMLNPKPDPALYPGLACVYVNKPLSISNQSVAVGSKLRVPCSNTVPKKLGVFVRAKVC
jgi:hypothetical protein